MRTTSSVSIAGTWRLRLNSDWKGYSRAFGNQACSDVVAGAEPPAEAQNTSAPERDGFPAAGMISVGPYSVLIFLRTTTSSKRSRHNEA